MRNAGLPVTGAIVIAGLLSLGGYLLPTSAIAQSRTQSRPATPTYTPRNGLLPKQTAYDCSNAGAVTLTRDAKNRDRFTYEGVNARGQKLTIKNGVGYAGEDGAIYVFEQKDGPAQFVIVQAPNGRTRLSTGSKNSANTADFTCTITKITRSAPRR